MPLPPDAPPQPLAADPPSKKSRAERGCREGAVHFANGLRFQHRSQRQRVLTVHPGRNLTPVPEGTFGRHPSDRWRKISASLALRVKGNSGSTEMRSLGDLRGADQIVRLDALDLRPSSLDIRDRRPECAQEGSRFSGEIEKNQPLLYR